MQAYYLWDKLNTESECVAELMGKYKELTKELVIQKNILPSTVL